MFNIVSFSGGKDSTAMLLRMIELNMQIDEVIFCDTGKEFPQMYEHIKKVGEYTGLKITWLKSKKSFFYYFAEHKKTKGGNIGDVGYGWPDSMIRWCTFTLKRDVLGKYYKNKSKFIEYVGIAVDEKHRAGVKSDGRIKKYPLIDWNWTEKYALEYCYSRGFNWGGLYEKFARVSCYLCPLQRISELRIIYNEFPELWADMKYLDYLSKRQFRFDYSIDDLEKRFEKENNQLCLFL